MVLSAIECYEMMPDVELISPDQSDQNILLNIQKHCFVLGHYELFILSK